MLINRKRRRHGLVLLIVLGMLSLLSLLAVTYVVFATQSRSASTALIKRDYRETPSEHLLDQAFRQVLRGTTDMHSVAWKNDLLGDLYGSNPPSAAGSDSPLFLTARYILGANGLRDNPQRNQAGNDPYSMPAGWPAFDVNSLEGPQAFGGTPGQFLKIPLAWVTGSFSIATFPLPEQWDAWNGRTITFLQGPLIGRSFRIIRYIGEVDVIDVSGTPTLDPLRADLQYTITIDLSSVADELVAVRNSATGVVTTAPITDWLATEPASLLYQNYGPALTLPYTFMVNAGVMNSNGMGLDMSGTVTNATTTGGNFGGAVPDAYLGNRAQSRLFNSGYAPAGDTDEPWDAADYQNFFMALKQQAVTGSSGSDDIIPSFHRPAILNQLFALSPDLSPIANPTDPLVRQNFLDFLELVQRATGRPVSYNLTGFGAGGVKNAMFSGSNGLSAAFGAGLRTPQLSINWTVLPNATEELKFQAWMRWMTRGPWDVDNDGDGVGDSVWTDLNFPLMTSPEGKLLKALVAFYIEDMDGKLDLNAAGNQLQVNDATQGQNIFTFPVLERNKYAHQQAVTGNPGHWPQGTGFGSAEVSLRPLFSTATEFSSLLNNRYQSAATGDTVPGQIGNDPISALLEHNRPDSPGMFTAPASRIGYPLSPFPMVVRGRSFLGLDFLSNPIIVESAAFSETIDDPYESHVLFHGRGDHQFTFSEYQRLVRLNDLDRAALPRRLQAAASTSFSTAAAGYLDRIRSISPRNVALTLPTFPLNYTYPRYVSTAAPPANVATATRRVSSFIEFVEAYARNKTPSLLATPPVIYFPTSALKRLFPLEFMQNRPLDLNRPLGNGVDDDFDSVIDEADEPGNFATYPVVAAMPADEYARDATVPAGDFDPAWRAASAAEQTQYSGNQAKQLFARHLYCLAQLILPAEHRFSNHPAASTTAPTPVERARILAQWAVNVVDFRDQDASMTSFPYDSTTFAPKTPYWQPDAVVWGMEQPELLMTETLAFHNLNIRRQPMPPPGMQPTEQLRVPQGSLFMEFFCPRTTSNVSNSDGTLPPATGALYTLDGTIPKLNLNRTAPNPADPANPFPVWRVAFLNPQLDPSSPTDSKDAFTQAYESTTPAAAAKRYYYTYQVNNDPASGLAWMPIPDTVGTPIPEPVIDRVMWFADIAPAASNHALPHLVAAGVTSPENRVFRYTAGQNLVAGGQFLVVGPRPVTYLGSKTQSGVPTHRPSHHRFQILDSWVQIWNQNNEPALWALGTPTPIVASNMPANATYNAAFADRVRECVGMTAGMQVPDFAGPTPPPNDWLSDPQIPYKWIGLNVSEPTREAYYQKPDYFLNSADSGTDADTNAPGFASPNTTNPLINKDAYIDLNANTGTPPTPLDKDPTAYLAQNDWDPTTATNDYPGIRTEFNWTAAALQRLADPARPFHAIFNPYITVDWMSIDLTVFSGEENLPNDGDIIFASRQKTGTMLMPGQATNTASLPQGATLYSYHSEVTTTPSTPVGSVGAPYFDYELPTELYTASGATPNPRGPAAVFSTLGYLNPRYVIRGTGLLQTPPLPAAQAVHDYQFATYFKGVPGPNPWGAVIPADPANPLLLPHAPYFANRDFVNAYELTSVPLSSPGQFQQEFAFNATTPTLPRFTHTLDFEDLHLPAVDPYATPPANRPVAGQDRSTAILLECVGVRSPWVDAWKVVNPVAVRGDISATRTDITRTQLFEPYRAPFNSIPTFREPGRINLNTAVEPRVIRGLMWNIMTPTDSATRLSAAIPFYTTLVSDRQGYSNLPPGLMPTRLMTDPNPHLDPRSPSEFLRVFGSPLTPYNFPSVVQHSTTSAAMGLLRHRLASPANRLFDTEEPGVYPNAAAGTGLRNSFTFNYPVSRMANLVTNRSNVFSVRMTLGYFEFDGITGNIGQEYGSEQGRSKRHRAFYMVDRSIPVGYETGKDLNTDNCVLLRSVIE
ncbi:MAG: hypothetical protein IT423_15200 [Pirellulaceae bacterium]|nr:hypothetical protein [Pirellulaceae bacterium]